MEILQQRTDALIEDRELFAFAHENRIVLAAFGVHAAVPIPLAIVERHHAHTCLNQASRDQHALRHARSSVAVDEYLRVAHTITLDHLRIFFRQVEGFG